MSTCIAYLPDGNRCRRPATIPDTCRGGLVCAAHAPDPDARPLHPVTGEEMPYSMAPYIEMIRDAEMSNEERWDRLQQAARMGG